MSGLRVDLREEVDLPKVGVSQPYIAKILRGRDNFTIATMTKLVRAVGGRLEIIVGKAGAEASPEKEVSESVASGSRAPTRESGAAIMMKQPESPESSKPSHRARRGRAGQGVSVA
jgi:transcriptional regulator with XRE-family HTH domain